MRLTTSDATKRSFGSGTLALSLSSVLLMTLTFAGVTADAQNQRGAGQNADSAAGDQGGQGENGNQQKGAEAVPEGQELVNIDFPEPTDIKDIIKAVSLWTGKNVILDKNVRGKVQIISPKKVTKEEAYQAFLSALNVLNLTTVETGKVIKIMPVRQAVKGNLKTFLGSSWTPMTDEIITQIVPLKYIDASSIRKTLSRIVSSRSMIAYEPTNTLIISDTGYKVRRILDIIKLLDVKGQQRRLEIVPIRYASADDISKKISELLENSNKGGNGGRGSSYRSYKIMTDKRTNSVIIYGPPRTIDDVKKLVRRFDVEVDDPSRSGTIHIRPLDYADAKQLASTLSGLSTASDNRRIRRRIRRRRSDRDREQNAEEPSAALLEDVKITADEASNSLLITGSQSAYEAINSIIRKLDIRRSQVYVESDILDINMNDGFNFGSSVFTGQGGKDSTSITTTWQGGDMAPLVASQAQTNQDDDSISRSELKDVAGIFAKDLTVGILSGQEVNIAGLGTFKPGALIRLIKSDSNTRVLSSPHVLTSNNEEAEIVVGQKIFFRSEEVNPQSGAVVNKVEKEDVDLTLSLKPNISHSNYVTMDVELESNSATTDANTGLPKVNQRESKQIVTVKNGQTVVISGLVKTREEETYKKIPLLGDIPILGWLFRNSKMSTVKNNLMIFMTPHIVHGAEDLAAVYESKVEERDQFMEAIYGSDYADSDFYARMPSKEDGKYREDKIDRAEKRRRRKLLKNMYEDMEILDDTEKGGGSSSSEKNEE